MAATIARCHHEKWDGSGYPDRIAGVQIPIEARIVALADVFDALLSKRPYKEPVGRAEAIAIIRRESGHHFDPEVVESLNDADARIREIYRRVGNVSEATPMKEV